MGDRGFTLIETIVATSLAVVVALMVVSGLLFMGRSSSYVKHSAETDESMRLFETVISTYIGGALNVDWTKSAIGDIGSGRGKIREFNASPSFPSAMGKTVPIAVFLRENGRPTGSNAIGEIRAAGMYFTLPTPTASGVLSISGAGGSGGGVTLSSTSIEQRFDQIVDMSFARGGYQVDLGEAVRVVQVRVVFRKFTDPDRTQWRWCPAAYMQTRADCRSAIGFRDIERILQITLPNNAIETDRIAYGSGRVSESLFGAMYFFRMTEGRP